MKKIPELRIGNLTAKLPIIQGGMGVGISMAGLASAVANEGGIGVISSVGLAMTGAKKIENHWEANKNALRDEIRKARILSTGIIGVNIMVALTDYEDLVKTSLEEKIDILFLGAGLPLTKPKNISLEFLKRIKTKIVPIVSSARAANLIFRSWNKKFNRIPDAVVVEGPKAGGHLGFNAEDIGKEEVQLEKVIPEVVAGLRYYEEKYKKTIPVIAAGGIFTGHDISEFLNIGASGVQMGTRFVATEECDADIEFKKEFIRSKKEDIVLIQSPVGLPGRAIFNTFLRDVTNGIRKPFKCDWRCLKTCDFKSTLYCIAKALSNARAGRLSEGFSFAGTNAYRIDKIISVRELMQSLKNEYERLENIISNEAGIQFA
jgi:nitronate monooxygenase